MNNFFARGVYCTFNVPHDGTIRIDCQRVKLTLSNDSSLATNGSWIIKALGLDGNMDATRTGIIHGDDAGVVRQLFGAAPARIVTASRVVSSQNDVYIEVGQNALTTYNIEASIAKDYTNQGLLSMN